MNLLDEQMRADQRLLLTKWKIRFRQIGKDLAPPGIKDANILPLLHQLKQPTLFTHDEDFFQRQLLHPGYCLVWLDTSDIEAALYIRKFLSHPRFNTKAKRMALVVRAHHDVVQFWQMNKSNREHEHWPVQR